MYCITEVLLIVDLSLIKKMFYSFTISCIDFAQCTPELRVQKKVCGLLWRLVWSQDGFKTRKDCVRIRRESHCYCKLFFSASLRKITFNYCLHMNFVCIELNFLFCVRLLYFSQINFFELILIMIGVMIVYNQWWLFGFERWSWNGNHAESSFSLIIHVLTLKNTC